MPLSTRSPAPRLAAVLALAMLLAGNVGCSDFNSFWFPRRLAGDVRAMEDPDFPDERRSGIAGIQRRPELKEDVYLTRFRQIAAVDASPIVSAQAIRALNQARDTSAAPVFIAALGDKDPKVRLEAVKALHNMPDDKAINSLTVLCLDEDQNRDVRIWSTNALGHYNRIDVARTLVRLLPVTDFAVAYEARLSLRRITGKDFYYDEGLWLNFLTGNPTPFARSSVAVPASRPASRPR